MKNPGSDSSPALLRQVLETLHAKSWAWALNCCDRHRADAEDVLQATYLKILDGRARFDGRSSMLTWVFAVIRTTAADHRRRRLAGRFFRSPERAAASTEADTSDVDEAAASPESALAAKQAREAVVSALAVIARRQREVVMLVYYHDLTVEQAATVMGVSVGAARQHYARGKRALHALLEPRGIRP